MIFSTQVLIVLISSFMAWILSQLFKLLWLKNKSLTSALTTSGGMPSSHSATVVSFASLLLLTEGLSYVTALALLFMMVVIRDSMGVRLAVGRNATILKKSLSKNKKLAEKVMVENGHTFEEVLVGSAIGLVVAFITYLIWFAI